MGGTTEVFGVAASNNASPFLGVPTLPGEKRVEVGEDYVKVIGKGKRT
jgi:hypothetical protein